MPRIIPNHVPSPRTLLAWDGDAYRPVTIDDAGRVAVRGMDQLVSFDTVLAFSEDAIVSGAGGYITVATVPDGIAWHIYNIQSLDLTSPTTNLYLYFRHLGVNIDFAGSLQDRIAAESWYWHGDVILVEDDDLLLAAIGSLAGDRLYCRVSGFQWTLEP